LSADEVARRNFAPPKVGEKLSWELIQLRAVFTTPKRDEVRCIVIREFFGRTDGERKSWKEDVIQNVQSTVLGSSSLGLDSMPYPPLLKLFRRQVAGTRLFHLLPWVS
jgi:hypothetical protein